MLFGKAIILLLSLLFTLTVLKRCHVKELITDEECRSLASGVIFSFDHLLSLQLKKSADVRQRTVDALRGIIRGIKKRTAMQKFQCKKLYVGLSAAM